MTQPFGFTFNEQAAEAAKNAGTGTGISTTGAYDCVINSAVLEFGKDGSQSQTLMISVESHGQKANYVRINFIGREGQQIFGYGLIMAMLWAAGVRNAQPQQRHTENGVEWYFPDLEGKQCGLVLQKVLTTKGDGSDGFKFEVRHVYQIASRKTYKEFSEQKPAQEIATLVEHLTDRDERAKGGPMNDRGGYGNRDPRVGDNSSWRGQQNGGGQSRGWVDPDAVPTSRLQQANRAAQPGPEDFDDGIPF